MPRSTDAKIPGREQQKPEGHKVEALAVEIVEQLRARKAAHKPDTFVSSTTQLAPEHAEMNVDKSNMYGSD